MLKSGCTPGVDEISTEHLKYTINTVLPNILSHLFTICAQFGVIPDSFAKGILIPILKKPNSDPTDPGNYRPITVSFTWSKLFETHIMDIYVPVMNSVPPNMASYLAKWWSSHHSSA